MPLILRTPDKKVKFTKEELQYFVAYLEKCKNEAFTGVNNYFRIQRDREELYQFSLSTLCEKLLTKLFNISHQPPIKKVTVPVNFAEEKTMLVLFNRVDCDSFTLAIQSNLTRQLRPLNTRTKI